MTNPVRRIVTGNDAAGRSSIVEDGATPAVITVPERPGYMVNNVWTTRETPADIDVIGAWLDGQRHQVFTAAYARSTSPAGAPPDDGEEGSPTITVPAGWHALTPHEVGAPADIARSWSTTFTGRAVTFLGDGAVKYAAELRAAFGVRLLEVAAPPALAPLVGSLAARATPGQLVRAHGIQPLYVRQPDVELARARRSTVSGEST